MTRPLLPGMKRNTDKCHLLISGTDYEHSWTNIDDKICDSNEVKPLG